ncbi:MAG: hypothetical protein IJ730_05405 [Alphaproteobacteria bacterium]|nr:hypothetical protein [Alphaproteobacteria bacterium]
MMHKNDFETPYCLNKISEIESQIGSIKNIVDNKNESERLSDLSEKDLSDIIFRSEKIALSTRCALEKLEKQTEKNDENVDHFLSYYYQKNMPVKIDFYDSELHIFTPLTFKRFYKKQNMQENYTIMNYVNASLNIWKNQSGIDIISEMSGPFVCMIIRKSNVWKRNKICDNDNLEIGRIVNEIFGNFLGTSDNALMVSIYSTFRLVSDES